VGDGDTDHLCWQRPEDMTTSRRAYKLDPKNPGTEVAAETAAAMAAAAIVFRRTNPHYANLLLEHAQQLFEFGDKYRGKYDESIPGAKGSVAVQGHRQYTFYLNYAIDNAISYGGITWAISEFSWDVKYAGLQIIASMLPTQGKTEQQKQILKQYRSKAEHYICACLDKNSFANVRRTPGGLLYTRQWNNMQYVSTAVFLLTVYSEHLSSTNQTLSCHAGSVGPAEILSFVQSQVAYILGSNPMGLSYLVGYGQVYPQKVHHRGASYRDDSSRVFIGCTQGYDMWYGRQDSNPNVLVGALVGGPDMKDEFSDRRGNYMQTEACTYNTAPLVGVFAGLSALQQKN
ncbi:endoglucanase, partial [Striga asiatica]